MNKEQFKEYADLKVEEKKIKARLSELGPLLKDQIASAGGDKVESEFGLFTLKKVPVWKYSPAVEKLEEEVDTLKKVEKSTGVATSEERIDLMYKEPKVEGDE